MHKQARKTIKVGQWVGLSSNLKTVFLHKTKATIYDLGFKHNGNIVGFRDFSFRRTAKMVGMMEAAAISLDNLKDRLTYTDDQHGQQVMRGIGRHIDPNETFIVIGKTHLEGKRASIIAKMIQTPGEVFSATIDICVVIDKYLVVKKTFVDFHETCSEAGLLPVHVHTLNLARMFLDTNNTLNLEDMEVASGPLASILGNNLGLTMVKLYTGLKHMVGRKIRCNRKATTYETITFLGVSCCFCGRYQSTVPKKGYYYLRNTGGLPRCAGCGCTLGSWVQKKIEPVKINEYIYLTRHRLRDFTSKIATGTLSILAFIEEYVYDFDMQN